MQNESSVCPGYMHDQPSSEAILIYVAVSGSMIPLRVLKSDSIESVKLRIQTYKGFVVKNQRLVCGGRELARSDSLVREYGVTDGNVLHLVLRLSDLQVISVRTSCGKEFTFHVERCRDVGYVKRQIATKKKGLVDLDDQEIICNGELLEDQRIITDICKNNNDAVIHLFVRKTAKIRAKPIDKNYELSIVAPQLNDKRDDEVERESGYSLETKKTLEVPRKPPNRDFFLEPVIVNSKIEMPLVLEDLVKSTYQGLARGNYPIRSAEGTGGAYFMMDASGKRYVSVFKPIDEEPMAVNNPRDLPLSVNGEGLKKGTKVGQGALREVAAYIIDHPKKGHRLIFGEERGFAGVPPTMLVKCLHGGFNHPDGLTVKIGSLQMFVENYGSCEDMGPGAFPVKEVHKISVLDIRMANADRHAGNILVSKGEDGRTVLIPIDHGYCLPESFEDCTFDWLYWPQARKPYTAETIEYIKSLDAEEDIALLKFYGWVLPLECARTLRISTMLLKKGAERGLTPYVIGSIMCRETLTKESVIEEIVLEALDSLLPGTSEAAFMESVSHFMDRRLDKIAK
ncbi:phosphatidylinositol 4-kinase gamma 4 [Rhododendron vialii]|uniref:phosphatidylinositol 4-kinase gamma 4 n=1 Tax=Rhododendron vialii TaxID=182163 RepID=UPI00265F0011|nr:phosphatidylinositol 4-kinase gamma 4 [Rhododendron vialii]XP_058225616.1 phosphatidylinositol 4-kinase gamma 4 [Rhododendron vialii]XP_058225617.1 phosphatidylinositol 4-kinase gamma 4 [Rhododendron vialii]